MPTNGSRRLRIAQVAPLHESVPPATYGGTERVVSYLTEALVGLGHEVTLFASGDSTTRACLVAPCAKALRTTNCRDPIPIHLSMIENVYRRAHDFDVIHFHVDYLHFAGTRRLQLPNVTTLHGRLDLEDLPGLYDEFHDMPVVSISYAQREPLPRANWVGNVYHGLPSSLHRLGSGGDYLAFVGRISPEKRLDRAIAIADLAGMNIKIAAKIDRADREYFERDIRPLFARRHVEFLGELDELEKGILLRNARALVFPIDWPEPFGLVMIEAMACGTPVIASRRGSVAEVIDDGVTGYIVDNLDEAVLAVDLASQLDRAAVRARFEHRFTDSAMARAYVDLYHQIASTDAADRSGPTRLPHRRSQLAHG